MDSGLALRRAPRNDNAERSAARYFRVFLK
jgi:hypothetical protein